MSSRVARIKRELDIRRVTRLALPDRNDDLGQGVTNRAGFGEPGLHGQRLQQAIGSPTSRRYGPVGRLLYLAVALDAGSCQVGDWANGHAHGRRAGRGPPSGMALSSR